MIELDPPLMSISERLQDRLGVLRDLQEHYVPNEAVLQKIGEKSLIGIVSPLRDRVIDTLVDSDPRFTPVLGFTTRDPRPTDRADRVSCLPWDDLHVRRICNIIDAGDAVEYRFDEVTGDVHGTTLASYPSEYNLFHADHANIAALGALPFRSTHIVNLLPGIEQWETVDELINYIRSIS